jgi:hypothetical protein
MNNQVDLESVLARHFEEIAKATPVDRRFVEVIESGPAEAGRDRGRQPRSWLLTAAASLIVVVGVGALLNMERSSIESDSSLELPAVCEPATDTTGGDDTVPVLDQSEPGFIAALPADATTAELVVRSLLNPRSGPGCLAYNPDTISLSSGESPNTVDTSVSLADGTTFDLRLTVERTPFIVGITDIVGSTSFDITTTRDGTTLTLDDVPERAATIAVTVVASSESSMTTVPADASEPIEILDEDGRPIRLLEQLTFNVLDSNGDIIDIGGRSFEPTMASCASGASTPCVAEVESFGSAFLTEIAIDFTRSTEIEAGSCGQLGIGDDAVTLCAVPLSDGRTVLLGESSLKGLTIRAGANDGEVVEAPFPPLPGIAVVVGTSTGDVDVIAPSGDVIGSISGPAEPTLQLSD